MNIFESNIVNIYGQHGKAWLEDLPGIAETVANKYSLSQLITVENLSYNYVLSGFQNNQPVILKLSLDVNELQQEATTLKAFAGAGAAKILAEDEGLLIIEQAVPGNSLKS